MKKNISIILVIFIYIGLPLLIFFNIINYDYKFYVLFVGGIIIYSLTRLQGIKNKDLGIKVDKLSKSIKDIVPITLVILVVTILLYILGFSRFNPTETIIFYLFYIFVSCPIQELLYRGYLNVFLNKIIKNDYLIISIASLLYSFVHIIYQDLMTLILTFIIGIIWHITYKKAKNLVGVVISHIILGICTIALGIIN